MTFFVDILREWTHCVRTQIFSKCRKIAIPVLVYSETRQFHLLQVQGNVWNRFRLLNKHLILSGGIGRLFGENVRKFQTAGYLVLPQPYSAAGYNHVDTGFLKSPSLLCSVTELWLGDSNNLYKSALKQHKHPALPINKCPYLRKCQCFKKLVSTAKSCGISLSTLTELAIQQIVPERQCSRRTECGLQPSLIGHYRDYPTPSENNRQNS